MKFSQLPTTEQPMPVPPPERAAGAHDSLVARLAEEMIVAWNKGERPGVEQFLLRHPELGDAPSAILDLLYEEISLRHECGEPLLVEQLAERFPAWKQQIQILVQCACALEASLPCNFPLAGETVGDFELVELLGRGGQGRVYVATQTSLADRPVVLKITPRRGHEHLSLARLQHTHIVPLLSAFDVPERNWRVLCMPYFGGLTLAALLTELTDCALGQRHGRQILGLLDKARATAPIALPSGRDPGSAFLARASYVQAICWLGACLAEALKYAHDRGLVHLDLKPSNVLITADRQPMLLDFHLARAPLSPNDPGYRFGGTPGYMSPEQKKAVAAIDEGAPVRELIDGRSDIYSLGLLLYEALGGQIDAEANGPLPPLVQCNDEVSVGLSDLLGKCLAIAPQARYQDAGALAADLWGHLNDMPLKGVANRSLAERWHKWRRRRPHILPLLAMLTTVLAVLAVGIGFVLWQAGQHVEEAHSALAEGQSYFKEQKYDEALKALKRGTSQLERLPAQQRLKEDLASALAKATRGKAAQGLHRIADSFRFLYGINLAPSAKLKALEADCRAFWDKRDLILTKLGDHLDDASENGVREDLLDMAILGSHLRVRLATGGDLEAARQQALEMLNQAEASFGPSAVLYDERRHHAEALGRFDLARASAQQAVKYPPRTAWEHYALGRAILRDENPKGAAIYFERALEFDPGGMWPNFYRGVCCYQLSRFMDSVASFTVCTTLMPSSAGCFFNRGLAWARLGQNENARKDFDRALNFDPDFIEAGRQRELLPR